MAKGQKQLQQEATTRSQEQYAVANTAQKRLVDGSPEFQAKKDQTTKRRQAIDSGTIADQSDFVSNRARVAERQAQRTAKANLTQSGVAGLASNYANPTQIALANQLITDEFSRDSAAQQEDDARNYINETSAMENDIINTQIGTDSTVMNSAFGVSQNQQNTAAQIAAQRASVLPSIIGMAVGAGTQIATGSGWFKKTSPGG